MTYVEAFASVLTLGGYLLLGCKDRAWARLGWPIGLAGGLLWIVWGSLAGAWCLVGLNAAIGVCTARGWWNWRDRNGKA